MAHAGLSLAASPRYLGRASCLLPLPASLLVAAVVVLPTVMLIAQSFKRYDPYVVAVAGFTLENYAAFFLDGYYRGILLDTLGIAAFCTSLALLLAFPLALRMTHTRSKRKSWLIILFLLPLLVGNVVRATGWMALLGNTGLLNALLLHLHAITAPVRLMYTRFAVILGITSVILPYMVLTLNNVLENIEIELQEAAINLGAGRWTCVREIWLPLALPGITAASVLAFVMCMNSYATPVLLGGTSVQMLTPVLYDQISKFSNWPFGAALSTVSLSVSLLGAIGIHNTLMRRYQRKVF